MAFGEILSSTSLLRWFESSPLSTVTAIGHPLALSLCQQSLTKTRKVSGPFALMSQLSGVGRIGHPLARCLVSSSR
jgi:hypothetical protein